ncbi:molybdopterin-containing oxidoreductase family iron-sulfur binding subunit [Mesonia hippocampi]|uniref:Molybdopterin-containing oxidoreductase family iron-sulfur binding subunit n=1 Tax=Mesonia hippocampi TaxID=1628250 RepID=A0A840EKY9_9FLAO|nr:TAT-variant-translocated molybdopterin oxidoreductase [Mesonia hippocampi]MBB4118798.1 molybdopterin-containing oxidoreductase family iron-sulfur binding subunit [Mesonia hippocampi]
MSSNKKYWKSVEELNENSSIVETLKQNEFVQEIPTDEFLGDKENLETSKTSRRDFLKFVGFSTAAASLAACEGPVVKSIPYVVQPERIVPGVANYYATTIADGFDFASVLVKTREGRPIKIENNKLGKVNVGANARVHASVLSLYDNKRLKNPLIKNEPVAWERFNREFKERIEALNGKELVVMTQTFASPSTSRLMEEFKAKYANVKHVVYDAVSESAALDAFASKYGKRALPSYKFDQADVVVSVGADFLGDWQGGGYDSDYALKRVPENGKMSRHIQFESNMSLAGANADIRVPVKPSVQKAVLAAIYYGIVGGGSADLPEAVAKKVAIAVKNLKSAGSKAVLITGIQDKDAQLLALEINEALASKVMDVKNPRMIRQGNATQVKELISRMNAGQVGGLVTVGVNPAYSLPNAEEFKKGVEKLDLMVSYAMKHNETAELAEFVGATPHYLESWGDVQFTAKHYSLMQPTIKPLFKTQQFQESLMSVLGKEISYYNYIKETWKTILGATSWEDALHDGVYVASIENVSVEGEEMAQTEMNVSGAARKLASSQGKGLELTLYVKAGLGDGQQANNPWLQEFPDPISRVSWDNYLTVSRSDAEAMGLMNKHVANGGLNGSYVDVTVNNVTLKKVPVLIQPGQAKGSVGLALGYGSKAAIQKEMQVGINAYSLYQNFDAVQDVSISKVEGEHEFACVQLQNTLMGRGDVIKETTLEVFNTKDKKHWNFMPVVSLNHEEKPVSSPEVDIWQQFDRSIGHHFNLSIDLNACTGCGACVIACHAENNVPVVGKSEVRRSRDMHWLRIDRYYSSESTFEKDIEKKEGFDGLGDSLGGFGQLEIAAEEDVQVVFQPVMCQHCNQAPCETVCPVAATSHGRQGQNHMAYNRCVGTRYCANNCPYKVRRFNWFRYNHNDEFDFNMNNDLGRMVLNPDVVVRTRGVMEKCSMCIQMTQKTILDAKREGRLVKDVEFQTACSSACTSGAMVFGDVNDEASEVHELKKSDRVYHLLQHIGTDPNVFYHTKVRNTSEN